MDNDTIKVEIDIDGEAFIVDACKTDGYENRLSTFEYMLEEISNCGTNDLMSVISESGIYSVRSVFDDYPEFTKID